MAVGSYIIAWTGHLVHGLIVEFNGLPGIAVRQCSQNTSTVLNTITYAAVGGWCKLGENQA
jgi:hypothetical protein